MYILNITNAIKKMSANELRDFIFESYSKQIRFVKEKKSYTMKQLKKRFILVCNQIDRKNT